MSTEIFGGWSVVFGFFLNKNCVGDSKREWEEPSIGGPVLCGSAHGKGYCVGSTTREEKGSRAPLCCERGGGGGGREMVCVEGNTVKAECVLSCVRGATADGLVSTVSISLG